jgi:hypothetical protein
VILLPGFSVSVHNVVVLFGGIISTRFWYWSFIIPLYVTAENAGGFDHRKRNHFSECKFTTLGFQRLTGEMGRDRLHSQCFARARGESGGA